MLSYFFGSTVLTPQQRLEVALKEKAEVEAQIKKLTESLQAKEEEIAKIKNEITPTIPKPPPSIPVTVILTQKSSGDVVSDFALHFRPDMSADEKAEVLKKIREDRQFRINLLPPQPQVLHGFAALMSELVKKCSSANISPSPSSTVY